MKNFAEALEHLMEVRSTNAAQLSAASGISNAQISKWRRGVQTSISATDFSKLAHALTDNPVEQAELLRAHLLDECHEPGAALIDILVKSTTAHDRRRHPTDLERAWEYLHGQIPRNQDLRDLLIDLARCLGMQPNSTPALSPKPAAQAKTEPPIVSPTAGISAQSRSVAAKVVAKQFPAPDQSAP